MTLPLLLAHNWLSPPTGAVVLLGLTSAGLGLLLNRVLLRRQRLPGARAQAGPRHGITPASNERRAWPRRPVASARMLLTCAGEWPAPFEAWVLDASVGGIGLLVAHPVEAGSILSLWPAAADPPPCDRVEMKYCRPQRGRWRLGCRFLPTSPEAG